MTSGSQIESGTVRRPNRHVLGADVCAVSAAMALPVDVIW